MTALSLSSGQLLTAAADPNSLDDRIREGVLVPWGEPGRTNLGPKRVHRGAVTLTAESKVVGVYGHNRDLAVSRLLHSEDRPEGLWGRVRVARTPLGDQLLAEIDDGARDGLSVELDELEFDAAGDVTRGRLDFFAHVPIGAYDSARVQLAATMHTPTGEPVLTEPTPTPAASTVTPSASPALDTATLVAALREAFPSGPPAMAAAPGGLSTGAVPAPPAVGEPGSAVARLATLQAAVATGQQSPQLQAALADITNTGLDLFQSPAGAVGQELWSGGGYTRRFVPLFTQKTLTSWRFGGWRWTRGPEVGDYAGDKAQIPTNPVTVAPVEGEAQRVAGGWDIDRKFRDFGDAQFWAGFYAAQTESYAERTDQIAAAALIAAAADVTVDANVPAEYAGVNVAQADILRATALGQAILEDTPNVRRAASFVLMNSADWLGLLDITNLDLPAFLALLGVQPGAFLRSPLVPAGRVILGVRESISFYELGGGAPIRVEALDIARAGIDSAVYGYVGTLVNRPGGIISVPLAGGA